jgi:hypothetical protein
VWRKQGEDKRRLLFRVSASTPVRESAVLSVKLVGNPRYDRSIFRRRPRGITARGGNTKAHNRVNRELKPIFKGILIDKDNAGHRATLGDIDGAQLCEGDVTLNG